MGLNQYRVDVNAKDWVSVLRHHSGAKMVKNINDITILVYISSFKPLIDIITVLFIFKRK